MMVVAVAEILDAAAESGGYHASLIAAHEAFRRRGACAAFVRPEQLEGYPVAYVPTARCVGASTASALRAYMEAGGMHGFSSFARRFPECLGRNDAPLATAGMAVLLVAGIGLIWAARRSATSSGGSDPQPD